MPSGKPKWSAWAAWLSVIALALNALVPVHFAFDLAEALTPTSRQIPESAHGLEWRVLASLTGHFESSGKPDQHNKRDRTDCPVCNSIGTLAGFAPTSVTVLQVPATFAAVLVAAALAGELVQAPATAYFSRAPPLA